MSSPHHRRSVDEESESESISSSTVNYPFFGGRRYHNMRNAAYLYPNDEHEQQRQDCEFGILQKWLLEKTMFFTPLDNPRNILDIGCGTGLWAIEMAEKFPNASVIGWDLSPIQPTLVPPNVQFYVMDCGCDNWYENPEGLRLDHIHVSMLWGALPRYDEMIRKAMSQLEPGKGWLECHELLPTVYSLDNSIPQNWIFGEWLRSFDHASSQHVQPGRSVMIADKLKHMMESAGYVDVHEFVKEIPVGGWASNSHGRACGKLWRQNLEEALEGWSLKTLGPDGLHMSREEIQIFLAGARRSLHDPSVHGLQKFYVVYGRRPSSAEAEALKKNGHKGTQMRNSNHPALGATFPASQHRDALHPSLD